MDQCSWVSCNKPGTFRCNSCKSDYYCSKECQKKAWKNEYGIDHKYMCKFYKSIMNCSTCNRESCVCRNTLVCDHCDHFLCCKCVREYKVISKKIKCKCNNYIDLNKKYSCSGIIKRIGKGTSHEPYFRYKLFKLQLKDGNLQKALINLELSAKGGYVYAFNELGVRCIEKEDYEKAFIYFMYSHKKGSRIGTYNLGKLYFSGYYVKKSIDDAIYYFKEADIKESYEYLGIIYKDLGNHEESFYWFLKGAKANSDNCILQVAEMYIDGVGISQNVSESINWILKAVNPELDSIVNTKKMLREVENKCLQILKNRSLKVINQFKNESEVIQTLVKKAVKGDVKSQYELYINFYYGYHAKKNNKIAKYWCKIAADCGNEEAKYVYGKHCLNDEDNCEKDDYIYNLFLSCYKKKESTYMLGYMNYYGFGTKKDMEKSFKWFKYAALQCDIKAMCELGIMYYNGEGSEVDCNLAEQWLKKSAQKGNSKAQNQLSRLYYKQNNEELGKYWLRKSIMTI